ncbi:uncharacterized protein LOC100371817 [Saccoglossus kowalevskii]|uniref:Uncharacterized protein LOC100371817 n=1 Tax=Saccoglossus kowalevskii TaxID=10224 RepID=A0ABM0M5K2_SACKO|nr:PREDICTED: uncharacterized protein LOC100371817 [Saccoglossus kowalevskii]
MNPYTCDDNDLPNNGSYEACATLTYYADGLYIVKGCYRSTENTDLWTYSDCIGERIALLAYECNLEHDGWRCLECCTEDLCNESGVSMTTYSATTLLFSLAVYLKLHT